MKTSRQIIFLIFLLGLSILLFIVASKKVFIQQSGTRMDFEIDSSTISFLDGTALEFVVFDQDGIEKHPEEASAAAQLGSLPGSHVIRYQIMRTEPLPQIMALPQFSQFVIIDKTLDDTSSWLYVALYDDRPNLGYYVLALGRWNPSGDIVTKYAANHTVTILYKDEKQNEIIKTILIPANGMMTLYE